MHARNSNMTTWARWAAVVGLILAATLGGCASQNKAPSANDYAGLYAQGRYSDAYDAAVKVAGTPRGGSPQAALIAGLSAQALGREEDASRWLMPLVDNADPNVAGKSAAALGLILKEQGQYSKAGILLEKAATRLPDDDDAARALMYAGDARRAIHLEAQAQALYARAKDKAIRDVGLKGAIADRLAGAGMPAGTGKWSVQAGAFSELSKAHALASRLSSKGASRVVPLTKAGKRLYYVRVGRYGTKPEADTVRKAVGVGAFVVDASDEK